MRMSRQFEEQSIEAIDPLETMPPAKKSMVIFFLVDTSKSMNIRDGRIFLQME